MNGKNVGRPRKKPEYSKDQEMQELLNQAVQLLGDPFDDRDMRDPAAPTLRSVATGLHTTLIRARKLLITADYYSTALSRSVQQLAASGLSIAQIAAQTGLSEASVYSKEPVEEAPVEEPTKKAPKTTTAKKTTSSKSTSTKSSTSKSSSTKSTTSKTTTTAKSTTGKSSTTSTSSKSSSSKSTSSKSTAAEPNVTLAPKAAASKPAAKAKAAAEKEEAEKAAAKDENKVYHISKHESGKWQVKLGKGAKALKLFDTQAEAIEFAKEKANNQEGSIVIHKLDGKIRKQNY